MKSMYTAAETAQLRAKLIEDWVKPFAAACFEKYSQLQSIVLVVKYSNEWEHDAVYDEYIFSLLENPDLSAGLTSKYQLGTDLVNLPGFNVPGEIDNVMRSLRYENRRAKLPHNHKTIWDPGGNAVPAFAAFCGEDYIYIPHAILRRQGADVELEIIGQMLRPERDGIQPKSMWILNEDEVRSIANDWLEGNFSAEYLYNEAEAAQLRASTIDEYVKPGIKYCFERHPKLKSATFLIAQYWNDRVEDEVHELYVFSVLETPDIEAAFQAESEDEDPINLPGLNIWVMDTFSEWQCQSNMRWDSMTKAIPAFAAFCKEGSHQYMEFGEAYSPYAIFRRKEQEIEVEIVGSLHRPWLNGIKPEMKSMYTAAEAAQLRANLISDWVKSFAAACFEKYSQLQSIMLLVQHYHQFAYDVVDDRYIFSILKNPDLSAARASEYKLEQDLLVNLPGFDNPWEIEEAMRSWRYENRRAKLPHNHKTIWDPGGNAIPAFAAFCNEDYEEIPYAILRRQGEEVELEIIGQMLRPEMDGLQPKSMWILNEDEVRSIANDWLEGNFSAEYLYNEVEAAQLRASIIDEFVKPGIKACFEQHPQLNSATFLVAQYWNDQAQDEVHYDYIFSVLETPDLEAGLKTQAEQDEDPINLPGLNYDDVMETFGYWLSNDDETGWDSMGAAIPAFAAFCKEGSHQCMEFGEAYSPYAIFRRQGQEIEVEVVGSLHRWWLNGIKPE